MATRTKKTDPFDYLLDSRRSDLLPSPRTVARIFLFAIDPHHSTGYHRIHILIIARTSQKPFTHPASHLPPPATPAFTFLFSLLFSFAHVVVCFVFH
jgi:hypothetical protein